MKRKLVLLIISTVIAVAMCSCMGVTESEIIFNKTDITLTVGETTQIAATLNPAPSGNYTLTWSSSNESVATVEGGMVTGVKAGKAVITAMTENGVKETCSVTVEDVDVTAVTLSNESAVVKVDKTVQLTAEVSPSDAPDDNLEWTSNNEDIAVVSSSGYVTGISAGTTVIKCTAENGKSDSCTITVKDVASTQAATSTTSSVSYDDSDDSDYVFSDSSYRKLSESEVSSLSSDQAQLAINEIYARHGYVFENKNVLNYFETKSWYVQNPNFSTSDLNDIENYNIALLKKYR